ncbi:hypothetical protein C9374_012294 [Naegleria lovaniensis]|uniref:PhoPQ-activated pathogenicity-related protein n=1 Tax=Naegleria lovaniensis TaxID=51637 RepID=A0AA88G7K4_NAELO|nr:uncharacterized protein C9374_012294 [Naegleria lovaniensis]KAG2373305.1 hypothetical protein C9374_012294 [Naegleria lovaniensis]
MLARTHANMLDEYMSTPGPSMSYSVLSSNKQDLATLYTLSMKGVTWLNSQEIGQSTQWNHYLVISVPNSLDRNIKEGLLLIEGGVSSMNAPQSNDNMKGLSHYSGTICSQLYLVPNQPITFSSDPEQKARMEDQYVSFSWLKFLNAFDSNVAQNKTTSVQDYEWIGHFPMVKTSARALDVIQDFVLQQVGLNLEKFTIAGTSKRGWATWLLGATDPRVKNLIPVVIQIANLRPSLLQINRSLCHWPEALQDYEHLGVLQRLNSSAFDALQEVIDPFVYRERYASIPTYMVNAMGDEFMWPELSLLSYKNLSGLSTKYLRYVPNTGHSLAGSDALESVLTFYYCMLRGIELPKYTFSHEYTMKGVHIEVKVWNGKKPTLVRVWRGNNPINRDFRYGIIGNAFWSAPVAESSSEPFTWRIFVNNPDRGYQAVMVELVYENYVVGLKPFKMTTSAYVIPDTYVCAKASVMMRLEMSVVVLLFLMMMMVCFPSSHHASYFVHEKHFLIDPNNSTKYNDTMMSRALGPFLFGGAFASILSAPLLYAGHHWLHIPPELLGPILSGSLGWFLGAAYEWEFGVGGMTGCGGVLACTFWYHVLIGRTFMMNVIDSKVLSSEGLLWSLLSLHRHSALAVPLLMMATGLVGVYFGVKSER